MVVQKKERIPGGWNGMRKDMEAGGRKLHVGDQQTNKLGWTSLTTLGLSKRYPHVLFPLFPRTRSLGLSLGVLPMANIMLSTKSRWRL